MYLDYIVAFEILRFQLLSLLPSDPISFLFSKELKLVLIHLINECESLDLISNLALKQFSKTLRFWAILEGFKQFQKGLYYSIYF